jgi:hypothetical protein
VDEERVTLHSPGLEASFERARLEEEPGTLRVILLPGG